jgi:hypothetical protein
MDIVLNRISKKKRFEENLHSNSDELNYNKKMCGNEA